MGKNKRLTVFWLLLALILPLGCGQPASIGGDVESFVEEGLSLVSLRSVRYEGSNAGSMKFPSGETVSLTITLNNPENITIDWESALEWELVPKTGETLPVTPFTTEPVLTGINNKTATLTFVPALEAETWNFRFIIHLSSEQLNRIFPDETFTVGCDTPPDPVTDITGGTSTDDRGMVAFRLPSGDVNADIEKVEITYTDWNSGTVRKQTIDVTQSGHSLLAAGNPADVLALLPDSDPLNCYFRPDNAVAGFASIFSVVLIDGAGQRSQPGLAASETVQCTVVYNANQGTDAPASVGCPFGDSVIAADPGAMVRTGYFFIGWNTAANGSGTSYAAGETVVVTSKTLTLYAVWSASAVMRTITFAGNGLTGSTVTGTVDPLQAVSGSTVTLPENDYVCTLDGITCLFLGWSTVAAPTGGTLYQPGGDFALNADTTLYARWTVIGGRGPGGGLVFYSNPDWADVGWKYLEIAPDDNEDDGADPGLELFSESWSGNTTGLVGTSTDLGSGKRNTMMIILQQDSGESVAKRCDEYSVNGMDDWFLPSCGELEQIAVTGCYIGSEMAWDYWSSSEFSATWVYIPWFSWSTPNYKVYDYDQYANRLKTNNRGIGAQYRPVRAFRSANETWIVTYVANFPANSTGTGSAPVDPYHYESTESPVGLGDNGMTAAGCTFLGWNTQADGNGTRYLPGETLPAPADNVVLYAEWFQGQEISDRAGLEAINNGSYGNYILMNNISLGGVDWTPISNNFYGTLDGNGYSITEMNTSVTGDRVGLFNTVEAGGTIKNLTVSGGLASPGNLAGLIAGVNRGEIIDCQTSGSITLINRSSSSVGGLVGLNESNGTIERCSSSVTITVTDNSCPRIGGLVGKNDGLVSDCHPTSSITSFYSQYNGGLAGDNTGTIENCTVTGTVHSQTGFYLGGLTGANTGILDGCSSQVTVTSTDPPGDGESDNSFAGGLTGANEASGTIHHCFATGDVSGKNHVGGLVGRNAGTITECYAVGNVAGHYFVGGLAGSHMTDENSGDRPVLNCYSRSSVNGDTAYKGGLIGFQQGFVQFCFATGSVNGADDSSLIGVNKGNTYSTLSGFYHVAGTPDPGAGDILYGYPKTLTDMQNGSTYISWSWGVSGLWNFYSGENDGYPCLTFFGNNTVEP